jgi:hypothetical protein
MHFLVAHWSSTNAPTCTEGTGCFANGTGTQTQGLYRCFFSQTRGDTVSPQNHHCHGDYGTPLNFGVPVLPRYMCSEASGNVQWKRFECSNPCLDGPFAVLSVGHTGQPSNGDSSRIWQDGVVAGFQSGPVSYTELRRCREPFRWADLADSKQPLVRVSGYVKSHILRDKKTQHNSTHKNWKMDWIQQFNWHILARLLKGTKIGTGQQIQRIPTSRSPDAFVQGILWYSD